MNPVTFNNAFTGLLSAPPVKGHIQRNQWPSVPQILAAPLFGVDWQKINDLAAQDSMDELSWRDRNELLFAEDRTLRLPFPQMRAEIKGRETNMEGSMKFALKFCMFNGLGMRGVPSTWLMGRLDVDGWGKNPPYFLMALCKSEEGQVEDVLTDLTMLDSRRGFEPLHTELSSKRLIGSRVVSAVTMMLYDIHSPANHVARVRPDAPGKSPQWVAAREHYVVLDRRHEANSKEHAEGAQIAQDEGKNKERISHSRRAHWRTFKHDRYKAAKGRRTWIKSIWVGPKVWRDMAGSIYQIIQ